MVAPKVPGALKAIGAGTATGAAALKLKNVFKSTRVKGSAIPDKDDEFIRSSEDEPTDPDYRKRTIGASKGDSGQGKIKIGKVTVTKKDPKTGNIIKKQKTDKRSELRGQGSRTGGNYFGSQSEPRSYRDHYEYDAFDIVSNYLINSKQVDNMDEALYVMTEMDAQTIQGIVEDFKKQSE